VPGREEGRGPPFFSGVTKQWCPHIGKQEAETTWQKCTLKGSDGFGKGKE
jgi:hypothetical protein